jgi:lysophospholipase L1-like esterase
MSICETAKRITLLLVLSSSVLATEEREISIVTFGDSTTATRGPLKVYSQILQEELPQNGQSVRVINSGVGGNSTQRARARFDRDVLAHTPDVVVIQFGINDSAVDVWKDPPATEPRVSLDAYTRNLQHFVRTLKQRHLQVILMTPNPLCWTDKLRQLYGKSPYIPADEDGFNVLLKQFAAQARVVAQQEHVPLIDIYDLFQKYGAIDGQNVADLLLDGMHPNTLGQRKVADAILTVLTQPDQDPPLIASISKETLWSNRDGKSKTWFHPRVCMMPGKDGKPVALMNLQEIGGSDYFGPVHWSTSSDLGHTWSEPEAIAALGRDAVPGRGDDLKAGVCDVTPQYHPQTGTVIALGHVVFYKGKYFARKEQLARYPVYVTRSKDGTWSQRKILEWDDPRGAHIYTNNCGQRVILPNGNVQMSFTFGPEATNRMVAGVHTTFDGQRLKIKEVGAALHNPKGRGLLEPSVTQFDKTFWMTMRAEDDRGYVSVSNDGLTWEEKKAWAWEDGTPLDMSTTQQHWLTHSDGLFLVYTRKDASNENVIRWRSPLWVAQVDMQKRCLIKSTERTVLPLVGDGVNDADHVALMGNFNVTNVSEDESWITVGEWMPRAGYKGDVLLARIRWSRPNRLPLW